MIVLSYIVDSHACVNVIHIIKAILDACVYTISSVHFNSDTENSLCRSVHFWFVFVSFPICLQFVVVSWRLLFGWSEPFHHHSHFFYIHFSLFTGWRMKWYSTAHLSTVDHCTTIQNIWKRQIPRAGFSFSYSSWAIMRLSCTIPNSVYFCA